MNVNTKLTDAERNAMLAVWDGYQPHEFITTALHFLDLHLPRPLLLPALNYLYRNNLRGRALANYILVDCNNGMAEFQRRLVAQVLKDPKVRLLAGKTFIV